MDYEKLLATRTANMKASAIRELLKVAASPGMISLGGGLPSPDSFPLELMHELTERVLRKYGAAAMQYDMTEGFGPLRRALIDYCATKGVDAKLENIYISSGSQGFLDAIGKVLVSPGDIVAVEGPTYLAALQALNAYDARYAMIQTDDEGLIPESLEYVLRTNEVKFVYTIPTFQNPSGKTIGLKRRIAIADIIQRYNVLLIEDDPYSSLRYRGEHLPTIKSMAPEHVIYVSTLSKIFAPGLRIGFCVAPEAIGKWLTIVKQGVDLHSSTYAQALGAEYLLGGFVPPQVEKIIKIYQPKLDAMLLALEQNLPDGYKWSRPEGGMFLWVEGPKGLDMEDVYHIAVKKNVAFVPGKYFFPNPADGIETMRLNFTCVTEEQIHYAIKALAEALQEETLLVNHA
ncbi:MAG: PLP-dependent aminotransferase family protein [Ignavibacteria bacterium]|nr:PLP-dependent aminotransferase family protein [Ignavibacteria bacterium]